MSIVLLSSLVRAVVLTLLFSSADGCTVSTNFSTVPLPSGYDAGSFNFMVSGHTATTNVACTITSSVGSTCCAGGGGWTFPATRKEPKGGTPEGTPAEGDSVTCTATGGGCTGQSGTCIYTADALTCTATSPGPPAVPPSSPPSMPPSQQVPPSSPLSPPPSPGAPPPEEEETSGSGRAQPSLLMSFVLGLVALASAR